MPKFIWKAKDQHGKETVQRLQASNALQAKEELLSRGFTDLRLQQDEIVEMAAESAKAVTSADFLTDKTPEEEAANFDGKFPGFWRQWWDAAKEVPGMSVVWMLLMGVSLYSGKTWLIVLNSIMLIFSLLPVLIFPFIYLWFGQTLRLYNRLNAAKVWSRWPEVYALAQELEKASEKTEIGVPRWEIARCKAQALAGMNRLDEGVQLFSKFANDPILENWAYVSHMAGIYDVAKQHDKALELRTQAAQEKPDSMNVWIDLSMHQAHRMNDVAGARATFAKIDASIVTELARPYLDLVEGMMLCREGNFTTAKPHFEKALKGLVPFGHNPLILSVVLLTESYLCLTLAGSGSKEEAAKLWIKVQPYLRAGREDELIGRIQNAMGSTA
jgi:tetratricopeptide (TPR) repeat protein